VHVQGHQPSLKRQSTNLVIWSKTYNELVAGLFRGFLETGTQEDIGKGETFSVGGGGPFNFRE